MIKYVLLTIQHTMIQQNVTGLNYVVHFSSVSHNQTASRLKTVI